MIRLLCQTITSPQPGPSAIARDYQVVHPAKSSVNSFSELSTRLFSFSSFDIIPFEPTQILY